MNFGEFTKNLKSEFENRLPDVFERVKNSPTYPVAPQFQKENPKSVKSLRFVIAACAVVIFILAAMVPVILYSPKTTSPGLAFIELTVEALGDDGAAASASSDEKLMIGLVTAGGEIAAVHANEAGRILLSNENLVGLKVKTALGRIAALTRAMGYTGVGYTGAEKSAKALVVSVAGSDKKTALAVKADAEQGAAEYFFLNKVPAVVVTGDLDKEKLVERARQFDPNADITMSVAKLTEILRDNRAFLSSEVMLAYHDSDALHEMKELYRRKMFAVLATKTENFIDEVYHGDRDAAFARVIALLNEYYQKASAGNAYINGKNVKTDALKAGDIVDNIVGILNTVEGYQSAAEKEAFISFAVGFRECLRGITEDFSVKCIEGKRVIAAYGDVGFAFLEHLGNLVELTSFEDMMHYVESEFFEIVDTFDNSLFADAVAEKDKDAYLAGLEKVVTLNYIEVKKQAEISISSTITVIMEWDSLDDYYAWANAILSSAQN